MLNNFGTLNKGKKTEAELIEEKFEITRAQYLRDLDKIRKKYAAKFLKLSSMYGTCL